MNNAVLIVHESEPVIIEKTLADNDLQLIRTDVKALEGRLYHEAPEVVIFYSEKEDANHALQVLKTVKSFDDNLPVVVIAKQTGLAEVVNIMKAGAYDFFPLPLDKTKFNNSVNNSIRLYNLTKRVFLLENQMGLREGFDDIIGTSPVMQDIYRTIEIVAKSNATVLVLGESGSGKELVAKAIHRHSPRVDKVFMDINCGAIPSELLENEMFGHEKGAYTGADRRYIGSFERASGGTIFLDEISEMSPNLQVKLLRFLQERNFTRVGSSEPINVDVRIVAATNRDLAKCVKEGVFREDLYYRLNVVPISIPSLRDRREDIPLLAKYFLQKLSAKNERIFLDFAPQAMEALISYDWPGNVRELENTIERVVVLNNDSKVKLSHLPLVIRENSESKLEDRPKVEPTFVEQQKIVPLELVERYAIEAALRKCYGNVAEASNKLKIGQATLYRKIKQYGLRT
ncbi:MAG: sigma-54 dependent transcriptional regulator [Pseudomonadota bacterium]